MSDHPASMQYEPLVPACDISGSSLGWAAQKCGPAFVYDLYVREANCVWVRGLLKDINADTKDNPLAPYINLLFDNRLGPYEWYLSANGKCFGSPSIE